MPRTAFLVVCLSRLLLGCQDDDLYFHDGGKVPQKLLRNRMPCSCQDYTCGCCAGISVQSLNFNRQACMNLTYDPYEFSVTSNMFMNENTVFSNTFSAKNPPPACMPIPVPYIPIPIHMCVHVFNIFTPGSNLHLCVDFEARVSNKPVLILHFDCVRMGADGFAIVKPEDNGGLEPPSYPGDDEYDEILEE